VQLTFEPLDQAARWKSAEASATERYGAASGFARISKLEDPGFVIDFGEALERCLVPDRARVLDLGVNTGDEVALMQLAPKLRDATFVGVDHSASALAIARARFAGREVELHEADLGALDQLALGTFDLVVSIGTVQSPGIDDRALLRQVIQHHVRMPGAVIFGFPNCRYVDGEAEYGTRMRNFRQPELGLLFKDVAFYRKYLQQHAYQVFVTGKNDILVTGVRSADD
jgi:SAM-dependent methyltransferase